MLAKERQTKIAVLIAKNGAVTTGDLVERFSVSLETVRRDLLTMEQAGELVRVHGGAVRKSNVQRIVELEQRNRQHCREKEELAQCALGFISEGDVIGLDAGSTAISVAKAIRDRFSKLTVVTYSLDVFEILRESAGMDVILCGGRFVREENAFYGALTLEGLKQINVQKCFLFPSAISLEYGVCCDLELYFPLYQQMVASAGEIYILADSSKFEKRALLKLHDMSPNHVYVTDSGLTKELRTLYRENGMRIIVGGNEP